MAGLCEDGNEPASSLKAICNTCPGYLISPFELLPTTDRCNKRLISIHNPQLGANPIDIRTKTDLDIHKRKVTEYQKIKDKVLDTMNENSKCLVIEFDYGQNLPLPKLNVNSHSYCQCDRNFAIYSKKLKRKSRVATGPDYDNIISKSAAVVNGKGTLKSWGSTLNPFFQRKPKSKGKVFTLQKYCKSMYSTTDDVLVCTSYNGTCEAFPLVLKPIRFSLKLSDTIPVALKKKFKVDKIRDVRSLYEFLKEDEVAGLNNSLRTPLRNQEHGKNFRNKMKTYQLQQVTMRTL
ncbi:hypothetical protein ANN_19003 [Periplaneta americana]|uniref:Uncharacterized protein n=1 Tax=Periplaneta americana TaxID=6978 RepID=A0ABQ8SRK2_PERAM|nr:hypothetical protein ANN_19003 [Periplaneta americana]